MTNEQVELVADRDAWLTECIGETPETVQTAVEAGGGRFRITSIDGKYFIGTRDYDLNRVNVAVVNGVVTEAHYG